MAKIDKSGSNSDMPRFIKVIYFDESTAQDYLDIAYGGRTDWSSERKKSDDTEKVAGAGGEVKAGFSFFRIFNADAEGQASVKASAEAEKILATSIKNILLTDYIQLAYKDDDIVKLGPDSVYAPDGSATMYKMISSYLTIVPKDQLPIDVDRLNHAVLDERGYYLMLLRDEVPPKSVLRFNIHAFRNQYNLADLTKMKLTFWGVSVGECFQDELSIDKEFLFKQESEQVTAEEIVDGRNVEKKQTLLQVYDIVLAGVLTNEKDNDFLGTK